MRTELFDYALPQELIAQHPLPQRDESRLLVVSPNGLTHTYMNTFAEHVPPSALLVVNDSRVIRARLLGQRRPGGGRAELLLLSAIGGDPPDRERWRALGRPARKLPAGTELDFDSLRARVMERGDHGELTVELAAEHESVAAAIERVGHIPLPPYVRREDEPDDADRYQTLYAARDGSVAAPTAGLHLSHALLQALERRGVERGAVTLHVGRGTFQPVSVDDLDSHPMHSEHLEVGARLAEQVARCRERGGKVVAIGTTVVRALESAADPERPGHVRPMARETQLLIQPGYRFRVVDALLTNFHMPKSTLLALVSAFAGLANVQAAYAEAVARRYRFLSYGDAMWIPERLDS